VIIDEAAGARLAIDHLYQLGHRRIAYVGGPDYAWSETRRSIAIREASAGYADLNVAVMHGSAPDASGSLPTRRCSLPPAGPSASVVGGHLGQAPRDVRHFLVEVEVLDAQSSNFPITGSGGLEVA